MSEPAISIRNLSKCYHLGTIGRHTLADELSHCWHKLRGRDPLQHMGRISPSPTGQESRTADIFWALRHVSFEVQPGEVLGIIGCNGAGKSTLLKILTRITEPTGGDAFVTGRVASLLEVGTGFHPDLTGRENIYMNGTILGMKRREITAKFDEIVAFSEIEKFIDTPVKRYSSGMYVRLAFAVAAHLEPEILLVDEVLAVGDAAFQRKCLGKMGEVARQGRTILFVSHNMAAVLNLCPSAVLLENGQVAQMGASEEVLKTYLAGRQDGVDSFYQRPEYPPAGHAFIKTVRLLDENGNPGAVVGMGQAIRLEAEVSGGDGEGSYGLVFGVFDQMGGRISGLNSVDTASVNFTLPPATARRVTCHIPVLNMLPGVFPVSVVLQRLNPRQSVDRVERAVTLEVVARDVYHTGRVPKGPGVVYFPCEWTVSPDARDGLS